MADWILCSELIMATFRTHNVFPETTFHATTPLGSSSWNQDFFLPSIYIPTYIVNLWRYMLLYLLFLLIRSYASKAHQCNPTMIIVASFGAIGTKAATKLQKLQTRAARILTFSFYEGSVDDLFKILGKRKTKCTAENSTASMWFINLWMVLLQKTCDKVHARNLERVCASELPPPGAPPSPFQCCFCH